MGIDEQLLRRLLSKKSPNGGKNSGPNRNGGGGGPGRSFPKNYNSSQSNDLTKMKKELDYVNKRLKTVEAKVHNYNRFSRLQKYEY